MKCKNDTSKTYKGTEPSPKGNGWCAHADPIGKRRKGTDGKMWVVSKTNTSQRWVRIKPRTKRKIKELTTPKKRVKRLPSQCVVPGMLPLPLDISKYVVYQTTRKHIFGKRVLKKKLRGIELNPGKLHKYVDLNQFEAKETAIPLGFHKIKHPGHRWLKHYVYNPQRQVLCKTDQRVEKIRKDHVGWKHYITHNNGGRPFLVYIKNKKVDIFAFPTKSGQPYIPEEASDEQDRKWHYMIFVASFTNVTKVWVGKSPKTPMTLFSGGHGPKFDGNTILLTLPKHKCVYIGGDTIKSFQTQTPIVEYWSPVGNSDVPYPVALTKKKAYFMLDFESISLDQFQHVLTTKEKQDLYSAYYHHTKEQLLDPKKTVKHAVPFKVMYSVNEK